MRSASAMQDANQHGAPSPLQQSESSLHRVKLYKLNETGGWDDKGTGEATAARPAQLVRGAPTATQQQYEVSGMVSVLPAACVAFGMPCGRGVGGAHGCSHMLTQVCCCLQAWCLWARWSAQTIRATPSACA